MPSIVVEKDSQGVVVEKDSQAAVVEEGSQAVVEEGSLAVVEGESSGTPQPPEKVERRMGYSAWQQL